MNDEWMSDARKIPDDVMNYIRRLAVHAVVDQNQNVGLIASIFRINRASLYNWLK